MRTVGGTFEWEKDFEYLHGVVNAFPTFRGADSNSAEAVVMLWLVVAVPGRKVKT